MKIYSNSIVLEIQNSNVLITQNSRELTELRAAALAVRANAPSIIV